MVYSEMRNALYNLAPSVCLAIGHTDAHTQQHGAAEARRAHNPEDVGSKPTVATFCF